MARHNRHHAAPVYACLTSFLLLLVVTSTALAQETPVDDEIHRQVIPTSMSKEEAIDKIVTIFTTAFIQITDIDRAAGTVTGVFRSSRYLNDRRETIYLAFDSGKLYLTAYENFNKGGDQGIARPSSEHIKSFLSKLARRLSARAEG